jgi:hypothetical protein
MKTLLKLAFISLFAIGIAGCDKDNDNGMSTVNTNMKSMPTSDYQAVKVEVTEVQIHNDATGWEVIDVPDQIYDLQLLQNDATVALGSVKMETGNVTQVRMILGDENSIIVNGVSYPLTLSSQDESGLKLNISQKLERDRIYTLVFEFDVKQSVVVAENNTYKLRPVLRAWFTS